ncbi:glycosyltransferase [Microvirga sp. ACRRW]|uniref:glycosyltransferase n=1 Tax=Microvirga sp. ACRRW TaxID=2918205 RepID=UPI001EF71B26|nr:glycosyltransferase [Microvirga sp. ACRRW]MCG7392454.1 glycosyltransferase [Microvirga sp. ACRRW]
MLFRPGSKLRRVIRTTLATIVYRIEEYPAFASLVKRLVLRVPVVGSKLRAAMMHQRALRFLPPPTFSEDGPADLSMASHSTRLYYRRLMRARNNLESGSLPDAGRGALPRLAYISPMPPEQSGIADYSAELLPELAKHYDIDVIVVQDKVSDPWINEHCNVRDQDWFERHAHAYDRIVYHIGNSIFHFHMLRLLERFPGVVVLHDFYQSGLLAHLEVQNILNGAWSRELYHSHGFAALLDRFGRKTELATVHEYPVNLSVLQNAQGIIVHSSYSKKLAESRYAKGFADEWIVIPHLRHLPQELNRKAMRDALGFKEGDFLICSFGVLGEAKLNEHLLQAWLNSPLADDENCYLVFVGQECQDESCVRLRKAIQESKARKRIRITGFAPAELYKQYLQAADMAVQLRSLSRGETSGTVLDCMAHGVPTVVNANGSMAELPRDAVVMLPDEFAISDLSNAIITLHESRARRQELGEKAREAIKRDYAPDHIASQYTKAIEGFAQSAPASHDVRALAERAASLMPAETDDPVWLNAAHDLARDNPVRPGERQLLVDVSVLAQDDYRTGIQRVVRAQAMELLNNPPAGFRVEPVRLNFAHDRWHYRYAREFTASMLDLPGSILEDEPVEAAEGDIFYMPDYWTEGVTKATQAGVYADWRARGIETSFLIHDILPLTMPEHFPDWGSDEHSLWLGSLADSADRLICISQDVADSTRNWIEKYKPKALRHLEFAILHHGADIEASAPSKGLPDDANAVLQVLNSRPSFLMVGTIEPRKGHMQVLDAFELLWSRGIDINLVIVGAEGWKNIKPEMRRTIPQIVKRLRRHPEAGKRLFWLEGISDEYLEKVYAACSCLIASSEGEGFGLPLIEAARHGIPILARDIPVFREVAGEHASYFTASTAKDLAQALTDWQKLFKEGRAPKSQNMPWMTWAENGKKLKSILLS